jgi:sugar lactone lactonase YvrE/4-amino-4-deoxy-L-arabinose transferase-like glycosyltransferase
MTDAGITPEEIRTREAEAAHRQGDWIAPGITPADPSFPSVLDRVIPFVGATPWQTVGWAAAFLVAVALRLLRLDDRALGAGEAAWAYDAWALFRGQPPVGGESIPDVGALLLLLQGIGFFLFGTSDVVARLVPALAGIAIVALPLTLRRWVGGPAALGMAVLAAISPALVYPSRVVSSEIVIAALALAAVTCLVRLGEAGLLQSTHGPAITLGIVTGAAYAAGASAITVILSVIVGVAIAALSVPDGTIRRGLGALRRELPAFLLATVATAILCFTRFLSYPPGIAGFGDTLGAWWRLLTESSGQPAALFLMALLVYEPIAVVFAIASVVRNRGHGGDAVALFAGWWVAAFTVWSFSAGHEAEHAVHVALPLVLLGGIGLGTILHAIDWRDVWYGSGGLLALLMLGIVVGLAAVGVLLTRADDQGGGPTAALPPIAVLCLVVVPLVYLIWRMTGDEREAGKDGQSVLIAFLVAALLLWAFGLRSANLLAFSRADLGTELLGQRTATLGTLPRIEAFLHLARDVGVSEGSVRDPTGSHGLSIALERDVQWPYAWYFREFPDLTVTEPGTAARSGAQVAIAASEAGLAEAGYATESWPWQTTVPPQYLDPDMGAILGAVVNPTRWLDVWRYLLFRDGVPLPPESTVAVGLTPELAGRVTPATGPFNLADRPGPGSEPGQFKDPIGVAVGADGIIAVVDSGNARVQRFARGGTFLGVWGEDESGVTFTRTANGLGPTGITTAPDGATWVADTWGHRVVALDANGATVQTIGAETIDTGDDPARVDEAGGRFFGPRDIAVSDDAIYVVDTGNERVQLFTREGAFVDAWGGYGSGPDQLIEPVGIALGADGNVYVADSGNARISIFTPDGEPVAQWPVSAWPAAAPGSVPPAFQPYLAFDADGNLYASASNAGQVLVFDGEGTMTSAVTDVDGERLTQPVGVVIAPDGVVLFTDVGRDAVLEYMPSIPADLQLQAEDLDQEDVGATPRP